MCTPLPTPSATGMGEKMARWPRRKAAARTSSRAITAWSAAFSAGCGAMVTSILPRAIFGQEGIRLQPGGAERGDHAFAEPALPPPSAEAIGMAGAILDAGIDELLLEGGDEVKPARRVERGDGAAQELARAALPRAAIGVADVAKDEMLRHRTVGEIDARLGAHDPAPP